MVQSYKTSAQTLRYQACDPGLEEDVLKPVSIPTIHFREKSTYFHGCDWSHVLPNQSHTSENNSFVQNYHLRVSHTCHLFYALFFHTPHEFLIWQEDCMLTQCPERHCMYLYME